MSLRSGHDVYLMGTYESTIMIEKKGGGARGRREKKRKKRVGGKGMRNESAVWTRCIFRMGMYESTRNKVGEGRDLDENLLEFESLEIVR